MKTCFHGLRVFQAGLRELVLFHWASVAIRSEWVLLGRTWKVVLLLKALLEVIEGAFRIGARGLLRMEEVPTVHPLCLLENAGVRRKPACWLQLDIQILNSLFHFLFIAILKKMSALGLRICGSGVKSDLCLGRDLFRPQPREEIIVGLLQAEVIFACFNY